VRLHLHSAADVRQAFQAIQESVKAQAPQAHVDGVAVQAMAPPGLEVIIGMTKDTTFGPVLMFGLGGVLVELIQDVAFRIVPLTPRDAEDMIRDIQGFPLLTGYRGSTPTDLTALQYILLTLSAFVEHTPAIKAMDLNPVYAYTAGAVAVDARIVLEEEPADLGAS
jgi:acyl-CoA synthetase (NDP forming)